MPSVRTGHAATYQFRGKTVQIVRANIDRRDVEETPPHGLAEIDSNAAMRAAGEAHVAMADAPSDTDRGDPQERAFDPPRGEVGERRSKPEASEVEVDVVIDIDECRIRADGP